MTSISIVMPVHNRATIVPRAIDSVLRQEFSDFELIVVDDGSSDDTANVVANFDDCRVRLIRQPANLGSNAARNRGIREARAPLIAFLDSDDEFLPQKIGRVMTRFTADPALGVLVDSYVKLDPGVGTGRLEACRNPVIDDNSSFVAALFGSPRYPYRLYKSVSSISLRREVALAAGLFNERVFRRQDLEFLARVAKVGRCATSDELLWIKHVTRDSITLKRDHYVAATIEVCRENPQYIADRQLRIGLARDMTRNLVQRMRRRELAGVLKDVRSFSAAFGPTLYGRLVLNHAARQLVARMGWSKQAD
jgi:glycosyltransferase involved in cell wall biosynthesis